MTTQSIDRQPGDFNPDALREHRHAAGLTQKQLAEMCGVSVMRIYQLEKPSTRTEPRHRLALAIRRALGVTAEQLAVPDTARVKRKKGARSSAA